MLKNYEVCKNSKCLSFENGTNVKALDFYDRVNSCIDECGLPLKRQYEYAQL